MGGLKPLSHPLLTSLILSTILRSSRSSNGECPTECFCPEATPTITCMGDRHLTLLPILNLSGSLPAGQALRLEIRDYVLPDLVLGPSERNLFFNGGVAELILSHNQIQGIRLRLEEEEPPQEGTPHQTFTLTLLDLSNNNLSTFSTWPEIINCKILDLSSNFLVNVNLKGMSKLESLNLRGNGIQNLPENTFEVRQKKNELVIKISFQSWNYAFTIKFLLRPLFSFTLLFRKLTHFFSKGVNRHEE